MHRDDLVSQVRVQGRLHGRNEARRVIRGVLQALRPLIPDDAFRQITAQLPAEIGPIPAATGAGPLVREAARLLYVDEPDAAFLSRIVFAQLNSWCHGLSPASVAAALPADARALVSARADDPAQRFRRLFPAIAPSAGVLSLRRPAAPAPEIAAVIPPPAAARVTGAQPTRPQRS